MGKWSWRFVSERNPLWKAIIIGKYGQEEGGWCTKEVSEGNGERVWKAIRGGWPTFKDKIGFKVSFGKANGVGDTPLRESFLDLYPIAPSKNA